MSKTICKSYIPVDKTSFNFVCKKCGTRAKKEKHLCKPKKI